MPRRIRFAITGLQQSGKSVFITSLINNLVYASEALNRSPDLARRGITLIGRLSDRKRPGRMKLFPFRHHLENLRKYPPVWPEKTFDVSGCVLELEYGVESQWGRLELELVDYPGERILDLPMMRQSYRTWSEQQIQKSLSDERFSTATGSVCRRELSAPWHAALDRLRETGIVTDEARRELVRAFQAYQVGCLEANMEFVQPSVIALEHFAGSSEKPWNGRGLDFCPLPKALRRDSALGRLYRRFERRYDHYIRHFVRLFYREMTRADVQIVLLDVLRILKRGVQSYNDIQQLTDTILEHFTFPKLAGRISWRDPAEKLRGCLEAMLDRQRVRKTIFTATKADLVRAGDRPAMAALVSQMVYKWLQRFRLTTADNYAVVMSCSANRATDDGYSAKSNEELLKALVSEAGDGGVRECCFVPPPLPASWPDEPWDISRYQSPWAVLPRKLPARDGAVINHIGLDRIISESIRDFLPGGH